MPFPFCVEPTPPLVARPSGPRSFRRLAGRLRSQRLRLASRPPRGPSGPPRRAEYGERVTEPVPHMTPEQFRQHGHEVVDWIADYWSRVGTLPVRSQVSPGEVRESLPPRPPNRASRSRPSSPTSTGSSLPGRHALAAPRLLRLLPGQHLRARPCSATSSPPGSACRACRG